MQGPIPKVLSESVREKFFTAISKGASYAIACGYAGIHYHSLRNWVIRAEAIMHLSEPEIEVHQDKMYLDFYRDFKRVESYAALKWLEKIDDAAQVHWQAAAWKLERRHPESYSLKEREGKKDEDDNSLQKARSEVEKLMSDKHGRSAAAED